MRWGPALGAALGLAAASCGGAAEEPRGARRQPIIDGTEDADDPAVVYIVISSGMGQAAAATGTVVSPHVVLTAAHVLSVFDTPTFRVFTGKNQMETGSNPDEWLSVREAHADPGFNPRVTTSGHDVAVLILSGATAIPPLEFNRAPATLAWIGMSVRTVGYGITSNTDVVGATAGVRRQGMTAISGVNTYSFSSAMGEEQPCGGDSGGPAFASIDGIEVLAGVVSNGDPMCNGVSFARVDTSAAFVDPWIAMLDPELPLDGGGDRGGNAGGDADSSGIDPEAREDGGIEEDAAADRSTSSNPVEAPSGGACAMRRASSRPPAWMMMGAALGFANSIRRKQARGPRLPRS
jgi:secreted trypsin-like serine protease